MNKLLEAKSRDQIVKYKIKTNIGRFYFYFEENGSSVSAKIIFFPDGMENH